MLFGAYIIAGLITSVIANGYMKKNYIGDSADQMFLAVMAGFLWPFTIAGLIIHVGGNIVEKYLEERQ